MKCIQVHNAQNVYLDKLWNLEQEKRIKAENSHVAQSFQNFCINIDNW